MPAKTTDYQKFSISFQNEAGDEDHASPPLTRSRAHQRSRSRGRLAAAAAPVSTPSQLLRFKEGPPKVLTKAANVRLPQPCAVVAASVMRMLCTCARYIYRVLCMQGRCIPGLLPISIVSASTSYYQCDQPLDITTHGPDIVHQHNPGVVKIPSGGAL